MPFTVRARGQSHGITFRDVKDKPIVDVKPVAKKPVFTKHYGNKTHVFHDIYVVDPSHVWPKYLYDKHRMVHFICPKKSARKFKPRDMSGSLASVLIMLETGWVIDKRYLDICANNLMDQTVDLPVCEGMRLEFYERCPQPSKFYFRYAFQPTIGLDVCIRFGPFRLYTDFTLSQLRVNRIEPLSFTSPSTGEPRTRPFNKNFRKQSVVIILDPYICNGPNASGEVYTGYDLVNVAQPDRFVVWRDMTGCFTIAAYCANKNKEYAAYLCKQWNSLIHAINGNIFDNTTQEHKDDCHSGRRCPYRTTYRCMLLSLDDTVTLDQLRDAHGRLHLDELSADIRERLHINERNIDRIASMLDIHEMCINVIKMTSNERAWLHDHQVEELGTEDLPAFYNDFLNLDKLKNEHIIVPRSGLKPRHRTQREQAELGLNDALVQVAAAEEEERHEDIVEAVVAEVMNQEPDIQNLNEADLRKVRDISKLLAPELQTISRSEHQKAHYIYQILTNQIPPELLPTYDRMSEEIRRAVEEFRNRLDKQARDKHAKKRCPILQTYEVSDFKYGGLTNRLISHGQATKITYNVVSMRRYTHNGQLPQANAHLPMLNPKEMRLAEVHATYSKYYLPFTWILRFVAVLFNLLTGWRFYHKTESRVEFSISLDLLEEAIATGASLERDLTTQESMFKKISRSVYLPRESSMDIVRSTFEVFVAVMDLNDERFLEQSDGLNCLSLWGTDSNLDHYQIKNLISCESGYAGFGVVEMMLLVAVLLPTVYSLLGVDLYCLFPTTLTSPSSRPEYATGWAMFQNGSTALLLIAFAVMYVVSVLNIYNQSMPMKILVLVHGCLDLITLSLAVMNYKTSMINTLVLAVPFLSTLNHSLLTYSLNRKCTENSNMQEEFILVPILRNVFISLLLIGLKKLFTNYLSSSSTFQLLTDWTFLGSASDDSISIMKLISQVLKHILLVTSTALSNWKFMLTCVVVSLTIWALISVLLTESINYSGLLSTRMNVALKICLFILLLGACQAKCLHPLATDSQITFLTHSYLTSAELKNMTELSRGMTDCSGFTLSLIESYLPLNCTNHWDSTSNSSVTPNLVNLASVVSSIQTSMKLDFAITAQYYLSLYGILSYRNPLTEELLSSECLNCYQHYVNALDALSSLLLSCEHLEILFDFYRQQVSDESSWILETLVTRQLRPALNNLNWDIKMKVHSNGYSTIVVGQKHWQKYVSVLKCANTSTVISDLNITNFLEYHRKTRNYMKAYLSLAVLIRESQNYFMQHAQRQESCLNNTSACPACSEVSLITNHWTRLNLPHGGITSINATRMVNSLVYFAKETSMGSYEALLAAISKNYTSVVSNLNRAFGSVEQLHDWYYETTDKLLFEGTIADFLLGYVARAPIKTFDYEIVDDRLVYRSKHSGFVNIDAVVVMSINWDLINRAKELFLNWNNYTAPWN